MDTTPATTRGRKLKVVALAVLLWAVLSVVVLPQLASTGRGSKAMRTRARLDELRSCIESYSDDQGSYPDRLALLLPRYLGSDTLLKDAWRRDFVYTPAASAGHPFVLSSNGPDGLPGTKDDLDAWTMN